MPDKLNVNELRKTLAPCQIRADQAEFAKQTTTILSAVAASPARDTVEISDAARGVGGWTYYAHKTFAGEYLRIRNGRCEILCGGTWQTAHWSNVAERDWRRMLPSEVDALALSNPAFAREHFAGQCGHRSITRTPDPSGNNDVLYKCNNCGAEVGRSAYERSLPEHQSQEKPDRHLSDDQKMQNILGNVAGALCGGPGALTESEWDGIKRHFANYAEYKDKTHLSQARFAIDRIIYERQQQARKDIADVIRAVLPGGEP